MRSGGEGSGLRLIRCKLNITQCDLHLTLDNLALLWIMGTFLYVFHPMPTEIGVYGGPTWPEDIHRDHPAILMTASATAYVPVSD